MLFAEAIGSRLLSRPLGLADVGRNGSAWKFAIDRPVPRLAESVVCEKIGYEKSDLGA